MIRLLAGFENMKKLAFVRVFMRNGSLHMACLSVQKAE